MSRITIIDPSSTEFNRGSFCYAAYLISNGLREFGHDVDLIEAFCAEEMDGIDTKADHYIVTLWSYPQIETALLLHRILPYSMGKDNVYFAGYSPLIDHLGLPHVRQKLGYDPLTNPLFLTKAMERYPTYYGEYKRLLLSDCDMHLKSKETHEKVYPLFTSYGCPNGCSFCPSTLNCERSRTVLPIGMVCDMLDECYERGIRFIHFTDEDFFFSPSRAHKILDHMAGRGFHTIALAASGNFMNFISTYGVESFICLEDAGMEVVEIGFETADEEIAKDMGNAKSIGHCFKLAEYKPELATANVGIFWLVQSLFPGENLKSLNRTGQFMRTHGYNMDEVVGRLRTNGTKGGLGQFFQWYHGLPIYTSLRENGLVLTERPIRLIPSYVPNSFLNSRIERINIENLDSAKPWLDLYNVENVLGSIRKGDTIGSYIIDQPYCRQIHNVIKLLVLARMGVIE